MKNLVIIVLFIFNMSCKQNAQESVNTIQEHFNAIHKKDSLPLKYAKGFNITDSGNYKILQITQPWANSEQSHKYVLISPEQAATTTFLKGEFDGIILTPIKQIVVTSTTHLPGLELLGVEHTLIGFPETDFISSKKIRQRIDNGHIRNLGKNEGINTEVLLQLNPDVVIGFGVNGTNKTFETIKNANIPVIYNGDWLESSPLAKAEWLKFFGVLFNKQKEADSIFNTIEKNYLEAKSLAQKITHQPTILSGAMYKDIWHLPNGTSTEAQLLKDANTNYLWKDTKGSGSIALSFESVFVKGQAADLWLSPSNYKSLDALKKANENYTEFKAFQQKNVYSFSNTTGQTGGVLYYELGFSRPDLVLKDIIKICHPTLLSEHELFFFKPLE